MAANEKKKDGQNYRLHFVHKNWFILKSIFQIKCSAICRQKNESSSSARVRKYNPCAHQFETHRSTVQLVNHLIHRIVCNNIQFIFLRCTKCQIRNYNDNVDIGVAYEQTMQKIVELKPILWCVWVCMSVWHVYVCAVFVFVFFFLFWFVRRTMWAAMRVSTHTKERWRCKTKNQTKRKIEEKLHEKISRARIPL